MFWSFAVILNDSSAASYLEFTSKEDQSKCSLNTTLSTGNHLQTPFLLYTTSHNASIFM